MPLLDKLSAPGGFDPGMQLSSAYLICPFIPNTNIQIPPAPYDEAIGDCALRGKSAEIETWLTSLEQIALSCYLNREPNWDYTLARRAYLDIKVDQLVDTSPISQDEEGQVVEFNSRSPVCPVYQSSEPSELLGSMAIPSHIYTDWLKTIGEDVEKYCKMIDELVKPLWQACDEINHYQDCQAPDPDQYHAIIALRMNIAQNNYDSTGSFYTNRLQTNGWGNFRTYYSESFLDCPPIQAIGTHPSFTFLMNANCRVGPGTLYSRVDAFPAHQSVQIEGRNQGEPRWWWVGIPGSRSHCWVSDATGTASGPLEDLEVIAAPPLVINPDIEDDEGQACSEDLGQSDCEAAGGSWTGGGTSAPYCKCD
jgi:hypothetical protein